jgi:hypothetical protein
MLGLELAHRVVEVGGLLRPQPQKFAAFELTLRPAECAAPILVTECSANLACKGADTCLVNGYNLFILGGTDSRMEMLCNRLMCLGGRIATPNERPSITVQLRSKRQSGRRVLMSVISPRFWRVRRPRRVPSESVTARATAWEP